MIAKYELITSAIDNAILFSDQHLRGLLNTIYNIPDYMLDNSKPIVSIDWYYWMPIKATIKASDFDEYEQLTGVKLPEAYIMFLGYKHFIELNFGHDVLFFKHTKNWIADNMQMMQQWDTGYTLKKGLLPFADMGDWGIVCFDTNHCDADDECNVLYLDHEDMSTPKEFKPGKYTFINLISDMAHTLEDWKKAKLSSE